MCWPDPLGLSVGLLVPAFETEPFRKHFSGQLIHSLLIRSCRHDKGGQPVEVASPPSPGISAKLCVLADTVYELHRLDRALRLCEQETFRLRLDYGDHAVFRVRVRRAQGAQLLL